MAIRMLIVDDEEQILGALSGYFSHHGYETDCARTVEEAEAFLNTRRYDIVLADLRLTGIEGVEGLEIISYAREKSPNARVVLLTAYGTQEIQEEAARRGASAFLNKPQPLAEIARVLDTLLESGRTN